MRKTIMIVGSAPNAKLVASDHIFFANYSAIAFTREAIRETGATTTTVCAASAYFFELFPSLFREEPDPQKPRKNTMAAMRDRMEQLTSMAIDETLAYTHKDKYLVGLEAVGARTRLVAPEEVFECFRKIGLEQPLRWPLGVLRAALVRGQKIPRKDLSRFLKEFLWKRPACFYSSGYFRPSSGLTAAAIAMATYGKDARYVISGVTFANRDSYAFKTAGEKALRITSKHIMIDRILMDRICRSHDVTFVGSKVD